MPHKKCAHPDCSKQPKWGHEGGRAEFCKNHAESGMVDVANTRCAVDGCAKRPHFGHDGCRAEFCKIHAEPGMVDVVHKRCAADGCNRQQKWGPEGGRPLFCKIHAEPGMANVVNKRCAFDGCDTQVSAKYKGYCVFHFVNLFPDAPVARRFKVREQLVVEFLRAMLGDPDIDFVHDKTVAGGCSRRRPDILIDCGTHVVIVEIDEDQHADYDCSCERKRAMQLWTDVNAARGHGEFKAIVFVRFNPDRYVDAHGNSVPSCFGVHKATGTYGVRAKHAAAWDARLDVLLQTVLRHVGNVPLQDFTEEHLFYDGFM